MKQKNRIDTLNLFDADSQEAYTTFNPRLCLHSLAVFILFCLVVTSAHAQLTAVPIGPNLQKHYSNARIAAIDTLKLPFFDDFALSKNGLTDPKLWQQKGGTYVSNTMTTDHPTLNVVVFDGTDASGRPYKFSAASVDINAQGDTDTLTSQPIDLGGLKTVGVNGQNTEADSVYLSFYFRREGLGELPDKGDSLVLQFKAKNGAWDKPVWGVDSVGFKDGFVFVSVNVPRNYLYKGFQFRFKSKGRQSGRFDTWFLDYVYLNTRTFANDKRPNRLTSPYFQDAACFAPLSSLLKRYSAMPREHYLLRPAFETVDSIKTIVRTLDNNNNFLNYKLTIKDDSTGKILSSESTSGSSVIFSNTTQARAFKIGALPTFANTKSNSLSVEFLINSTDNNNIKIPGVDFRRNDTITSKAVLADYYAYDDGTAEYAAYMNKPLGRVAVKFVLNKTDNVVGVKMNLVPILKNITDQDFTIFVWRNNLGKPGTVAYQKSFKVKYLDVRDQFIDFPFFYEKDTIINNKPEKIKVQQGVTIDDSVFYVGWMQIGSDPLAVGLDKNNKRSQHIFVNTGQQWAAYTDFKNDPNAAYFDGSLLIRPYLGKKTSDVITSTPVEEDSDWKIFPNPTEGIIRWETDEVTDVHVFSIGGSTMLQFPQASQKQINISSLPAGKYLIRLSNDKRSVIHKIVKL